MLYLLCSYEIFKFVLLIPTCSLFFGDYLKTKDEEKFYDEITDMEGLREVCMTMSKLFDTCTILLSVTLPITYYMYFRFEFVLVNIFSMKAIM